MDSYRDGAIVTVQEILRHALPSGTEVLAGRAHLDRQVASVAAVRRRPASLGDLRGGEIVLLSISALSALDPPPSLSRVIDSLADTAVAIAVRGTVADEAVVTAERNRIPLLLLPPGPPLTSLAREVQAFLAEQRTTWYQHRHLVLQELTALALEGRGLEAIADRMCGMSGCAAAFADAEHTVLAASVPGGFPLGLDLLMDQLTTIDLKAGAGSLAPAPLRRETMEWLSVPVMVRNQPAGTAYLVGERANLGSEARLVLEAGATASAIELAREHAVRETVDRIQGDLISDLVTASGNREDLIRRATRLGYNLDAARVAIAVQLDADRGPGRPAAALRRLRRLPASPLLGSVPYGQVPAHIDGHILTHFVEIGPDLPRQALGRIAQEIARGTQSAGAPPTVGISRSHAGPDSFKLAHQDAVNALELGRAVAPDRRLIYFDDLGIYRLLLSASGTELKAFHDESLGLLVAHDREKGSALVSTLDAYLRARNAAEAADRLSLHRNSLLYRLRRIREITGADLDDAETRLALHLALRAAEALWVLHHANEA